MQRIFLETTIQIQRLLQVPLLTPTIQATLQNAQVITSTYVWMEVRRTLGQDYQYLIDMLLKKQPTSLSQWLHHLSVGENLHSSRRLKRMLQIISIFFDDRPDMTIEPIDTAYLLDRKRQRMLERDFFEYIDQVLDPTKCDLIQPMYTVPPGGRMSCRRETAHCSLHELLGENRALLQTLQADSAALSVLETSTQRAFADIMTDMSDMTIAKGERNCWSLSDLIITLECPLDALLWTTNLRHFEPLCQRLGRQLFRPESPVT